MTEEILFEKQGYLGVATLNRPNALNALTLPMIQSLQDQLTEWESDRNIHAVLIQATPGKSFCAGGDVRWLYESGLRKDAQQMEFFSHEYRLNHYIHRYSKPYIALMNGITMGGGVGISLHGSHPVATENFVFAMPETGIGFFPDIGASYLLARLPNYLGVYLGLTGNRLRSQDALAAGLIKKIIPADYSQQFIELLKETDLAVNPHQKVDACLGELPFNEAPLPVADIVQIEKHFKFNTIEEILVSLNAAEDEWSRACLDNLRQKAPLSLKITLMQIHKSRFLSMAECIKMDYCLVRHFMKDSDFYEGVRALLVDKDKSPHWNPKQLESVSEAKVADYFECEQSLELVD
ncbi:Enoyl-CoA hydratase/carnithine racemase [Legionella birminghamensis]|uniref:3-hydroxyisobutyryl-CoA hydrolase n=1 Tax=Legionella birminghamensis TaxID=28083 RepID=A0A378IAG7_9GAMM|nr:enoyl-CoA hydratase/isomerase family protein [Legionella birminghamensis]KTC76139.1 Enoyl-CoA hydratase/carnithine racemase [Legionella birminghamensis]STX32237.1 enoyl-CoA hydratase/carnithine racemase [Legionella birminghamensis]